MSKCKQDYYYCYQDKKCKKIPTGYRVGMGGWLRREKDEESDENKNTNGNGNDGNGNTNGNGNGGDGGGGMSEEKKDHEYSMARSQLKTIKNAASRLEKKMGKKGEGELKAWVQSKITKAADYIDTAADYVTNEETITEKRDGKSAKDKGYSLRDWFKGGGWKQAGGKYDGKPCAKQPGQTTKPYCRDADDRSAMSKDERDKRAAKKRKEDPNPDRKGAAKIVTQKNSFEPEGNLVDEGKKDACYHKVKSRYSVWPSAYASGALVKCRKKGAANWGNSTKKEGYDYSNWRDDFKALQIDSFDIIKTTPLQATDGIGSRLLGEKHDTPKNVKKIAKELDAAVEMHKSQAKRLRKAGISEENVDEAKKCWKGYKKAGTQKLFGKTYNRCVKAGYEGDKTLSQFMEDWQKSNRKDGVDGMSQKSVNAYKRENPGSKLQTAVTTKPSKLKKGSKSAKRRSSYCSRSKGQKDMHNIDCTKTPDKKICKARKRWNC